VQASPALIPEICTTITQVFVYFIIYLFVTTTFCRVYTRSAVWRPPEAGTTLNLTTTGKGRWNAQAPGANTHRFSHKGG
jgi:hypothetical protein